MNSTYSLEAGQALDPSKLDDADKSTERQVKKAEAYFNILPEVMPLYSHFTPALWLLQNPGVLAGDKEPTIKTLERFEILFKTLNALLGK